jgi:uncharacterized protein (TIGR02246 family)
MGPSMSRALRSAYLPLIVAAAACSGGQGVKASSHAARRAGVDSASKRLVAALRANDSDSLMALMADDVVLMPPNEAVLRGKAGVRAWYDGFLTQLRTTDLTITDREVLVGPEWTTEVASFEWTLAPVGGGPSAAERGSYVQVWHHEADGRWLFARELWNSTAPAETTPKGP